MPTFLKNKHTTMLLLSLLITLFFSLPSLASLRGIDSAEAETWALQRFFLSLVTGYLLVVPLFYANLLGKPHLQSRITTQWVRLVIIVIVNLVLVVTLTRLGVLLQEATLRDLPWIGRLRRVYLFRNLIILGIVLLTVYIIELFQRSQSMYLENARLREENVKTQLAVLKEQMNPHFLFNSLNSLAAVIRTDQQESLRFVQKLAEVFRYVLQEGQPDLTRVRQELRFLEAYLFMLEKRFGDKLLVQMRVSEAVYDRRIPSLALQTLVENAVKHNVITTARPLTITISSDDTTLVVANNLQKKLQTEVGYGIGLANLNQRYQMIARRSITITNRDMTFAVALPLL